eukprot:96705_1
MSDESSLLKWIRLASHPSTELFCIPSGRDRNNYIVIHREVGDFEISSIYKYNIENDKWIKIDFDNTENIPAMSTALDIKKETSYSCHWDSVTQISLTNNHISNYNHNASIDLESSSQSIIINYS